MLKKLTEFVTDHPIITIIITLVLTGIFFYGLRKIEMATDDKSMLPDDDPRIEAFDELDETFGGTDFVLIILDMGEVFSAGALHEIDRLTLDLERVKGVCPEYHQCRGDQRCRRRDRGGRAN